MKQNAFHNLGSPSRAFGGSLLAENTNPKHRRPLSSKLPIHLVLRARRSWMRSPKHFGVVNNIVNTAARKHGVRIYEFANVGNHLHILMKITRRPRWAAFIRELSGRLAMRAGGGGVWERRPFTRVVDGWVRAFRSVREYVKLNAVEAEYGLSRADQAELRRLRRLWRPRAGPFDAAEFAASFV